MRHWILRRMYELAYWLCDNAAPSEAPVFKGFYTRFKKPSELKNEELDEALKELLKEAMKE